MIRLMKGEAPAILAENAEAWTADIIEKVAAGEKISDAVARRYAHPQIKTALLNETHEKCAYCESKLSHIAYGDIEHIIAKVVSPERAVDWLNLTIACDKCNQNKSDHEGVIDPYTTDPAEHLVFLGPILRSHPTSELGELTIRLLQLNRPGLIERRLEKIDAALALMRVAGGIANPALRALMHEDAAEMTQRTEEFSATVAAAVRLCAP